MAVTNIDNRVHLHNDDRPLTLAVLQALDIEDAPGFERTSTGAFVDWDELLASYLSSTEKAAIHVARGLAIAEWNGEFPPRARNELRRAVEAVNR